MRIRAYAGYFKGTDFREIARLNLGKRKYGGYVYDWYLHPVGEAVVLYTEHGDPIVEDRLGNTLRALTVSAVLGAMQDDNDEAGPSEPRWTWEAEVLSSPLVTHVVLTVW